MTDLPELDLPPTSDNRGHVIELGSTVKSYDFPDRPEADHPRSEGCFCEGVVEGCVELEGCARYKIRVTRHVFGGNDLAEIEDYVYPPLNGTPKLFGGTTNGVVVLEAPQPATAEEALQAVHEALQAVVARVGSLDPKTQRQIDRALALAESYQNDLDAYLTDLEGDPLDRLEFRRAGCRERDHEVRL